MPALRGHDSSHTNAHDRLAIAVDRVVELPPGIDVDTATSAVLCVFADRLTAGQTHGLVEGLPETVRRLARPCEAHRRPGPVDPFDRAEMLDRVAKHLGVTPAHAATITAAVLGAIRAELPRDTADHVAAQLPRDLKALWLASSPELAPPGSAAATGALRHLEEDVERSGQLPEGVTPTDALRVVLRILSARLSRGQARDVLLGLPDEARPLFEDAVLDRDEPARLLGRPELTAFVADRLGITLTEAEGVMHATLGAVKRALPVKEIDDVASELPADLRDLWLAV